MRRDDGVAGDRDGSEAEQFRAEISMKAERRKSAAAVTVNFSSGLHLTAA